MPRLKTFQAHLGFFDTVVAARSQKAALQAWGSRQNLFRDGTAKPASDPDAIALALAKPGVVLKRLAGSKDAFSEQPPPPKPTRSHRAKPVARKPPDRSKLEAAEHALAQLKQERQTMRGDFERREKSLRAEQRKREQDVESRQNELEHEIASQRKRFRKAVKTRS
ncbi:MAG TPA: cell envelope biogenesis protein TolA [Micropepsaceae bacterium]|nr:cell envelope biogenesis protein TolA [Micropepsaceae bacterium]